MNEKLHRIPEACDRLGIGRTALYSMRAAKQIQFVKLHGRSLVPSREIDRIIAEAIKAS